MSRLKDTISCIVKDISPLSVSREDFLASCVKDRLNNNFKKYDDEFTKYLEELNKSTSCQDLSKLSISIKTFSDTLFMMYDILINDISKQTKFINKLNNKSS